MTAQLSSKNEATAAKHTTKTSASSHMKSRKSKKGTDAKITALVRLIEATIQSQPFEFDGNKWAAAPQELLAAQMAVSAVTVRRLIAKPPFIRKRALVHGKVTTLLRVGEEGPPTDRDLAIHMRNIWRKKLGKGVSRKEFGCLIGLAKAWGKLSPKIFALVLNNWSAFMAGVKIDPQWTKPRFLKFPNVAVMRRFPHVGAELWLMTEQQKPESIANGNAALDLLKALAP